MLLPLLRVYWSQTSIPRVYGDYIYKLQSAEVILNRKKSPHITYMNSKRTKDEIPSKKMYSNDRVLALSRFYLFCRLLYFSSASIFKVLQCGSKLVKMLSECQTAWIRWDAELLGVSSGSKLFAYGNLVVLGGLWVNCAKVQSDLRQT